MDRRRFLKLCVLSYFLTVEDIVHASGKKPLKVRLKNKKGEPFKLKDIVKYKPYIYFYPYVATPCILIDTGEECINGIGENKGIVSFSLICTHQFSFPKPLETFIAYYKPMEESLTGRGNVIQCCVHMSVFDAVKGGAVIDGPAERALLQIRLEVDERGGLWAVGVDDDGLFKEFFEFNRSDLKELYGSVEKAQKFVKESVVIELSEYTRDIIKC